MEDSIKISWTDYDELVTQITLDLQSNYNLNNTLLLGMNRGGLPTTVHLSHLLELPMSILNYRHIDGIKETTPEVFHAHTQELSQFKNFILVDDIHDSGHSMDECRKYLELYNVNLITVALSCNTHYEGNSKLVYPDIVGLLINNKAESKWVVFPWEQ